MDRTSLADRLDLDPRQNVRCQSPGLHRHKPPPPVSVQFLGTCSGGGPVKSRQCSSLAVDFGNNVWVFDAADGTNNRLHASNLRMGNITRIFITHMHADHVLGIVAIMGVIMSGVGQTEQGLQRLREAGLSKKPNLNIYGPAGLRCFIRNQLNLTRITLAGVYAVSEFIQHGEKPSCGCKEDELHINEAVGRDLYPNEDGVWPNFIDESGHKGVRGWSVSAGPLKHRVPSLGYVLQEPAPRHALDTAKLMPILQANAEALAKLDPPVKHPFSILSHLNSLPTPPPYKLPDGEILYPPEPTGEPGRKIVIFGDCSGGTPNKVFERMCSDASLLVHECTNAAIPESVGKGEKGRKVRASQLEQSLERRRDKQFERAAKDRGVAREPWIFHGKDCSYEEKVQRQDEFEEKKRQVKEKANSRGHATPEDVGKFAAAINARRVAVNHFSAMFPSPHYLSNDPYPSLLGPKSQFPYPTTSADMHNGNVPPGKLDSSELHLRLIMQSLANQVSMEWNRPECEQKELEELSSAPKAVAEDEAKKANGEHEHNGNHSPRSEDNKDKNYLKLAVPSRDFMVMRVPQHELTANEIEDLQDAEREIAHVMKSWAEDGGAYVDDPDGRRRWVGIEPEPKDGTEPHTKTEQAHKADHKKEHREEHREEHKAKDEVKCRDDDKERK